MLTRLSDDLIDHEKLDRAADQLGADGYAIALGAMAWGIVYANRQRTDGRLTRRALSRYHISEATAQALVDAGLWHVDGEGFVIHDFLDWNPSAEAVKAKQATDRERKRRAFGFTTSARNPDGIREDSAGNPNGVVIQDRTGTDLQRTDVPTQSALAQAPRPSRGLTPPAPRNAAYAGRVCVPDFLDAEFERKGRMDYAARQAWYRATEAQWADKDIGDSDLDFWRKRFTERFPPTPNGTRPKSFAAEADERAKAQTQFELDKLAARRQEAARLAELNRQCAEESARLEAEAMRRPRSHPS